MGAAVSFFIALGLALAGVVYFFTLYNRLVRLRAQVQSAFAPLGGQLRHRYDLIADLVEAAEGFGQEGDMLEELLAARDQAAAAAQRVAANPVDGAAVAMLVIREKELKGACGRLFAAAGTRPDRQTDPRMIRVGAELATAEEGLRAACPAFNEAVAGYNDHRRRLPLTIVANALDFPPAAPFETDMEVKRTLPVGPA